MRLLTLITSAILLISILLLPGCGGKKPDNSSKATTTTNSVTEKSSGEVDSDIDGETSESGGADSTPSQTQSNAQSSGNGGGKTSLTSLPSSKDKKWGSEKGLTSTKKVPDWMRKIPSGKIVMLGSRKLNDEDYNYYKTVFKALTGKELQIEWKIVEWNSLGNTLQTMVLAGNAPDIFSIYNGVGVYLRNKGLTRDIKDYINMNDAAWEGMKSHSEVLFYKGDLTGIAISPPLITGGFIYNKTLIKQAGLTDPWELYKKKQWNINKFLEYVEELTVDQDHNGVPEVYGVSMPPESLFRMSLSSGEDIVKINADGSFSNNLRSPTFTRWASYASRIKNIGSYDTESHTRLQRFAQNKVAMSFGNIWDQFTSQSFIDMKKAGKMGWVPNPMDIRTSTYYHCSEITYSFLPKNSKNPKGGAAYYYMLRYMSLNPNASQETKTKNKWMSEYGWTAEEFEFQKNMSKSFKAVTFNWMNIPDFSYKSLWKVFTDDWSKLVEEVYPSLQSALKAQNK